MSRPGINLLEIVIGLFVLAVIAALLIPATFRSREVARRVTCEDHLRSFGAQMLDFADVDPGGRYCTGAYDYRRDGDPSVYGWVADAVNVGKLHPQRRRCPANSLRASQTLNDLLDGEFALSSQSAPLNDPSRWQAGLCRDFQVQLADGEFTGSVAPGDPARAETVAQLLEAGYGTNYSASWFLVRTGAALSDDPDSDVRRSHADAALTSLSATIGPLQIRTVEMSPIPSGNIPLLADAASATTLSKAIPRSELVLGDELGFGMTGGPASWDAAEIRPLPPGTVLVAGDDVEGVAPAWLDDTLPAPESEIGITRNLGEGGRDRMVWLQDTRGWSPVHAGESRFVANVLMADGSVKQVADLDGDGFLNPGFPIAGDGAEMYVELAPWNVYSGADIRDLTRTSSSGEN